MKLRLAVDIAGGRDLDLGLGAELALQRRRNSAVPLPCRWTLASSTGEIGARPPEPAPQRSPSTRLGADLDQIEEGRLACRITPSASSTTKPSGSRSISSLDRYRSARCSGAARRGAGRGELQQEYRPRLGRHQRGAHQPWPAGRAPRWTEMPGALPCSRTRGSIAWNGSRSCGASSPAGRGRPGARPSARIAAGWPRRSGGWRRGPAARPRWRHRTAGDSGSRPRAASSSRAPSPAAPRSAATAARPPPAGSCRSPAARSHPGGPSCTPSAVRGRSGSAGRPAGKPRRPARPRVLDHALDLRPPPRRPVSTQGRPSQPRRSPRTRRSDSVPSDHARPDPGWSVTSGCAMLTLVIRLILSRRDLAPPATHMRISQANISPDPRVAPRQIGVDGRMLTLFATGHIGDLVPPSPGSSAVPGSPTTAVPVGGQSRGRPAEQPAAGVASCRRSASRNASPRINWGQDRRVPAGSPVAHLNDHRRRWHTERALPMQRRGRAESHIAAPAFSPRLRVRTGALRRTTAEVEHAGEGDPGQIGQQQPAGACAE